jgi:hypothetical protein
MAELLLLASFAFLSLRAAYLDLPLGYCSSPEILRVAFTESSGVALFCGSPAKPADVLDLARYRLTKLSESSLLLYLLEYPPAPLSELSSLLNLLSDKAELEGSGEVYRLYLLEDAGLKGVDAAAACSLSWPQDPPYAVVLAPE